MASVQDMDRAVLKEWRHLFEHEFVVVVDQRTDTDRVVIGFTDHLVQACKQARQYKSLRPVIYRRGLRRGYTKVKVTL